MNKQKEVQPDATGQQNVPQKKKDIKTTLRNLLVLVLVAAVSIVGTLAFLSSQSKKAVNTFTGSAGIDLTLTEDKFDKDMANGYTPEMTIPKNPTLTNTSDEECKEWVAFRVDYTWDNDFDDAMTVATRKDLEDNIINTLNIDTATWIKLTTKEKISSTDDTLIDTKYDIYLYKTTLGKATTDTTTNETTPAATLFTKVEIKDQDTLKAKGIFNDNKNKYMNFNITLYGAAIKNDASLKDYASLGTIKTDELSSFEINMDDLDNAISDTSKDSQKIAVALAKLLKTTPTEEID